jgi:hypothetical protein
MQTFKREIETILFALQHSNWAAHAEVGDVIAEYQHLMGAAKTPTQSRRVSLQIFHASRAIDSLLKHMAEYEARRVGRPINGYLTLKRSLNHIQRHRVGGQAFTGPTVADVNDLTDARNRYLHVANGFPADSEIRIFLSKTVQAIGEAITFPA